MSDLDRVDLTDLASVVNDLAAARELIRELKEQEAAAAAVLKERLGDGVIGTVCGVEVVRIDRKVVSTLDKRIVQALLTPEQYAVAIKNTPSAALRLVRRP